MRRSKRLATHTSQFGPVPTSFRFFDQGEWNTFNELVRHERRDDRLEYLAYVPPGSISKGKDLVTTGGARIVNNQFVPGKTTPCITCHREDLMGAGDSPPIVGRSPSYMARQMWDIQQGVRHGEPAQLMKLAIANLTPEDLIAIAAYVASLKPAKPAPAPIASTSLN